MFDYNFRIDKCQYAFVCIYMFVLHVCVYHFAIRIRGVRVFAVCLIF